MLTASWCPPSWRRAGSVAAIMSALQAPAPVTVAECTIPRGPDASVYGIVDRGSRSQPRWWLSLRSRALGDRVVELPLPDAEVDQSRDRVTLSSASRNGGLAVEIEATADKPMVDVFVNFELEVNVWRDLSPDVEHMNTDGPRRDAVCRVLPPPAPWH